MSSISDRAIRKLNSESQAEFADLIRSTRRQSFWLIVLSIVTQFSLQISGVPGAIAVLFAMPWFLGGVIWGATSIVGRYFSILAKNLSTQVDPPKGASQTTLSVTNEESDRIAGTLSRIDYHAWLGAGKPDLREWDFATQPSFEKWLNGRK